MAGVVTILSSILIGSKGPIINYGKNSSFTSIDKTEQNITASVL